MKSLKEFKEQINEVLKKSTDISTWIHDFVHSDDPKFAGKSKEERIKMAKGAYYAKQKESVDEGLKDACWKGYEAIGTKKKNGKEVPNCVPVKEGKVKELSMDIDDLDDKDFEKKYKKSKTEMGAKNSPVKKATQSTPITSKNEELVGKQKNIDINKNGKIDKDDLSKLRGEGFIDRNVASDLKNLDGAAFAKKYNKTKAGYRKMGNVRAEEVSEGLGDTHNTQSVHVTKPTALRIKSYVPPKKLATAPHKDRPVTAAKSVDTGVTATIAVKGKPVTQDKDGKPVTQTMEKRPVTKPIVRSKADMKEADEKKKEVLPFEPDPKPKKMATPGKYGYGPSVAKHLAKLGLKGLKKEGYKPEVEKSFPASGVKTGVSAPNGKANTMPKDKEKAKGQPAGSIGEEVKKIDEISKDTLRSYVGKAEDDLLQKHKAIKNTPGSSPSLKVARQMDMYKRLANVKKAYKKITKEEVETIEEAVTRKHFQQVADLIKSHEDPKKRAELAHYHAGIFKGQNPRFDHGKFMAACDVKEGAMCHKEEQIDELSKTTLQSYRKKAAKDVGRAYAIHQDPYKKTDKDDMRKLSNRVKGDERAEIGLKKEDVQLDEISKKTLGSYVKKASHDARMMGQIATDFENRADKARLQSRKDSNERLHKKYLERAWKRDTGIGKAVDRLAKEEVEQIDELSKKTLANYVNKAAHDATSAAYHGKELAAQSLQHTNASDWEHANKKKEASDKELKRAVKRLSNIPKATTKLAKNEDCGCDHKKDVKEAIAKPLPVQHAVDAVHATLGPKSATRFLSHLKPGTEKHTTWDKVNKALVSQGVQTRHIASIAQKTSHMNEEAVDESRGHKVLNTFFKNRDIAQRAYQGNPAQDSKVAAGGGSPAEQGIAAAKKDAEKLKKEETMITYKEFMAQLSEARYTVQDKREADEIKKASDPLAAYSDKKHPMTAPTSNVKKVAGKAYGGSNQKDDDESDEKPETKEKRGRGRPAGSKSGARRGGSKSEYRGLPTYTLNLPNSK